MCCFVTLYWRQPRSISLILRVREWRATFLHIAFILASNKASKHVVAVRLLIYLLSIFPFYLCNVLFVATMSYNRSLLTVFNDAHTAIILFPILNNCTIWIFFYDIKFCFLAKWIVYVTVYFVHISVLRIKGIQDTVMCVYLSSLFFLFHGYSSLNCKTFEVFFD